MLCDNCGQRKASYHKGNMNLCAKCVQELVFDTFDIDFFENFNTGEVFEIYDLGNAQQKINEKTCDLCGTKTSDLKKTARLGCSRCYSIFAVDVKNMIDVVQGGQANHTGKGVAR